MRRKKLERLRNEFLEKGGLTNWELCYVIDAFKPIQREAWEILMSRSPTKE